MAMTRKVAKLVAKYFPLNAARIRALRIAGYQVGHAVYIGEELQVTDELNPVVDTLVIGERVSIAQRVIIILSSHSNSSKLRHFFGASRGSVTIGNDAWVGAGAIILPNVRIGEMAVIGAGSIVNRDVAPRTIVAGNPARVIGSVDERR